MQTTPSLELPLERPHNRRTQVTYDVNPSLARTRSLKYRKHNRPIASFTHSHPEPPSVTSAQSTQNWQKKKVVDICLNVNSSPPCLKGFRIALQNLPTHNSLSTSVYFAQLDLYTSQLSYSILLMLLSLYPMTVQTIYSTLEILGF